MIKTMVQIGNRGSDRSPRPMLRDNVKMKLVFSNGWGAAYHVSQPSTGENEEIHQRGGWMTIVEDRAWLSLTRPDGKDFPLGTIKVVPRELAKPEDFVQLCDAAMRLESGMSNDRIENMIANAFIGVLA